MGRTGARIVVDALLEHEIEYVFGVPGAAVIHLYDELYDAPVHTVLARHEQGAGHMADGYARATGRPGVCIATSGPGATNLVTALATAHADSVPVVAITGQVRTSLIGTDAFQEADMTGITRPVTKHNRLVTDAADLPRALNEAFHVACTGRPGPVLIDIPADVSAQEAEGPLDPEPRLPGYRPTAAPCRRQLRRAAEAVNAARRPVLYAGGGVISAGAERELAAVARTGRIPVTTTLMGLGAFPASDPLSLHMLGMHGAAYANRAVQASDLLIAVGARFDDRVTGKLEGFAPEAAVVHVDVDPASIGKNVAADLPIVADASEALAALADLVEPRDRAAWLERIGEWKRRFPLADAGGDGRLSPQSIIGRIHEATGGRAIVCTDVGQHQMWAAQHYPCDRPRSFLTSGGLGTMGYGLPAAIGAQLGRPDETVVLITGDGSLQMNAQEMATAAHLGLPLKIVLMNNGYLGMVRQWQELFLERRYSGTELGPSNPDFPALAAAYGAVGIRIERSENVGPAVQRAMEIEDGPVLMDFRIPPEENVFPMVPAQRPIDQMLHGPRPAGVPGLTGSCHATARHNGRARRRLSTNQEAATPALRNLRRRGGCAIIRKCLRRLYLLSTCG
ncbi:MAG: biosynthetic-type acetolactate synthase large subunit [Planctomycetota bacterium]